MLEYKGQYGTAYVMIDEIDSATVQQIYTFLNNEVFTNHIAIMPDTHAGSGAVIGFTMPMTDKIIPNVVGVDIGCGMLMIIVSKSILGHYTKQQIDELIREAIPFGTDVHKKDPIDIENHPVMWNMANISLSNFVKKYNKRYDTHYDPEKFSNDWFQKKCEDIGMDYIRAVRSIGTLGGGNHFIEMGKSVNTGDYYFTFHSGSRQFGLKIANYWQKKAGKGALAYLEGDNMFGYLTDMVFAQSYAMFNRSTMVNLTYKALDSISYEPIASSTHNFIDFDDFIIRKGAIRSYENEKMIIPFNMEDGILLCEGKSNPEWNYSAPHGAGRKMKRSEAKKKLKVSVAEQRMKKSNIYASHLPADELKEAYKDPQIIENAIEPTATIIDRIKPVLAMKE